MEARNMTNALSTLSEHLAATVEKAGQSAVSVHARPRIGSSGVHWSPGIIVTASHTIHRDQGIRVTIPGGSTLDAELVGRDAGTDLAVLRVPDLKIPVAARAENASLQSGNIVLSVGRFKDSVSAAFGVISSISGPSPTARGGRLDRVVRLDIALHPGAAGGAVVDASGALIGIATAVLSQVSVFAIPLETIARVTETLLKHGRIPSGYLGVGLQPVALPQPLRSELQLQASAALIAVSVDEDAAAGRAGMIIGDILLELGGRPAHEPEQVQQLLGPDSIGKKLNARILRGGKTLELDITVGERPARG
jgi:S1-C subfamily serine protease